ncbi:murein transglycosylase A [Aetokthonos hydrillicola Thurmond2011]|uniref:peptidoglycan lytic exotransglycosylase n=1 Tax=Aetokthonos hydrillicola Thurmond2011 TaxID=2712845 RepID=A0AAP5I2R1_9CYAN|nr:murein transglycosylase A [Aetokthonos hydrillicola]MBO3457290.1 murein transglycosylase A [Aetokthonos hydrillicola CCALA 1050]MBW4586635.1 murein transglycosylase A [Aetokthonos hydrillicola CCALA 1050]MDR9894038.1 murein transglycosylase A [Aetokthonos hydrillicola Thurmond2011]
MRKTLALVSLSLGIVLVNPVRSVFAQVTSLPELSIPIPVPRPSQVFPRPQQIPVPTHPKTLPLLTSVDVGTECLSAYRCLGWDEQIWGENGNPGDRDALLASIDNSLRYMSTDRAIAAYQNYPIKEITLDRVHRSLLRFRQLVVESTSPAELEAAVRREFVFYKSVGNDGRGTVKFTSYYNPVYTASRVRTSIYRYPIYRLPSDFAKWSKPHPQRIELEGKDGLLGDKSRLHGLELFWFRDRLQAYLVQIQGSAELNLTDGTTTSVGYVGGTDYPWTSIGRELAKDGKLPLKGLTLPTLVRYFQQRPQEMNNYLPRWKRFVFFGETKGAAALGSIRVPVTPERSIATDKSLMPPGALALINTNIPYPADNGKLVFRNVNRFVLDQDTGSAIKGPGRVDYYMGVGELAGERAGITGGDGQLYYLLLRQ